MESLNLAAWLPCTEVEGPGRRAAIWLQGCDKRCIGCCNPEFLAFVERKIVTAKSVAQQILEAKRDYDIEGVTFLGGEPLLQAKGLGVVAEIVSSAGLSVMIFTGYTMEELNVMNLPGVERLLQFTDVLVDGPYEAASPDEYRNWVGSTNQRFLYLSDRYNAEIEQAHSATRGVEWRVSANGVIQVNGWPCRLVEKR